MSRARKTGLKTYNSRAEAAAKGKEARYKDANGKLHHFYPKHRIDLVNLEPIDEEEAIREIKELNKMDDDFAQKFYGENNIVDTNLGRVSDKMRHILDDREAEIKKGKVAHVACKKYFSFFTRYFFKHQYNKKFIVGEHHKKICALLERVLAGEVTKCIINIPPRYGKTELAVKNFIAHGLALNPSAKFIHLSYSKSLALDNSDVARDILKMESFRKLFPDVQIKAKSDSKEKWMTTAGGGVYATATGGQVTGFGAGEVDEEDWDESELDFLDGFDNIGDIEVYGQKAAFAGALIIDDPIKPEDADSELIRNRVNERFDSTIRNRVNSRRTPIIIIMQRLHENDLCGHILQGEDADEWEVLSLPAIVNEGKEDEHALWEHKHDLAELRRQEKINKTVFERQMMQKPMPKEGLMYDEFEMYSVLPITLRSLRKTCIDTADKGSDSLCEIDFIETETAMYITNVYYTADAMETTEIESAKHISRFGSQIVRVELNNGGDGWKRKVANNCRLLKNLKTKFIGFNSTGNKEVRIFQKSSEVTNLIKMPIGWETMWPKFAKHVKEFSKVTKNTHDDPEDVLTMMCEWFGKDKLIDNSDWRNAMQ